jgi:hypothetical protein
MIAVAMHERTSAPALPANHTRGIRAASPNFPYRIVEFSLNGPPHIAGRAMYCVGNISVCGQHKKLESFSNQVVDFHGVRFRQFFFKRYIYLLGFFFFFFFEREEHGVWNPES